MNFHRKSKSRRKIAVVFIVMVFLVFAIYKGILGSLVSGISGPLIFVGDTVESVFQKVGLFFSSENKTLEENKILKERIDTLERQLVTSDEDKFESNEFIRARVLVRPSQNIYGSLVLERIDDGEIHVGDIVLTTSGFFVGIVDEVNFSKIKVKLSSHPGFRQDVSVDRSGIPVSVVGIGGGNMKSELPQGSDIEQFDLLIDLPTGRIVGEVGNIEVNNVSAFMEAFVRMPVNIFEIQEVEIAPHENTQQ